MAHPRLESPTAVGLPSWSRRHVSTPAPSQPRTLPVELWQAVFVCLDDHCFAWFILRQVSHFLKAVIEDVFARRLLRNFRIGIAGQTLRNLL